MKTARLSLVILSAFTLTTALLAQTGPFDPGDWPATKDPAKKVHYVVTDGGLTAPSADWTEGLNILTGGDQVTEDFTIGGRTGKKVIGNYMNIADAEFAAWADSEFIDILMQVYGNEALFTAGLPRNFHFLTGTLPELAAPSGGQIPVEAKNKRWNWVLFRIPNGVRASDGTRFVGSIPANAQGAFSNGGVNGGTIRSEGVGGLIVRVVAFGEEGAFGPPEEINKFLPPEACAAEPATNLAGIDVSTSTADHVQVINDGDQTVTFEDNIGPAGDKRRAVRPNGLYLNFGITDSYLGQPCNDPRAVKVCLDFFDDAAFAGANVRFGPEAYATDDKGGVAFYPADRRQVMQGSGKWVRRSWTIPAVCLKGINAGALTAGPRFASENGQVSVSRYQIAVLRVGEHPLAGQDPLTDCVADPNICTDVYGNYAELDLGKDLKDGLDVGSSGGDQEMIVAEAGPATDRRQAVRPARDDGSPGAQHWYLNFAILDQKLGPSSQPPARLAICVTYYDDPNLIGARFKPEVYITEASGVETFVFVPDSMLVTLEGTDQWRTAYWEIPDVKFSGVNQGPQAAARFFVNDKVFFTRVRYAVIRPCGPLAGVNLLESCKPVHDVTLAIALAGNKAQLSWPAAAADFTLEETPTLVPASWTPVNTPPETQGENLVVTLPIAGTKFYRLVQQP